jgi:hypothetical protein
VYGGEKINAYRTSGEGNIKKRDYLENLVVDARKNGSKNNRTGRRKVD